MINDHELLVTLIYLIIRIVEREVFEDYRLEGNLGPPSLLLES